MENNNRLAQEDALRFVLGGRAFFVLYSQATGNQFRFKVVECRDIPGWNLFDFTGLEKKRIGWISDTHIIKWADPLPIRNEEAAAAFRYFWKKLLIQQVPDRLEILHTGNCSVCGRELTDAISLTFGIGPECRKKIGL